MHFLFRRIVGQIVGWFNCKCLIKLEFFYNDMKKQLFYSQLGLSHFSLQVSNVAEKNERLENRKKIIHCIFIYDLFGISNFPIVSLVCYGEIFPGKCRNFLLRLN